MIRGLCFLFFSFAVGGVATAQTKPILTVGTDFTPIGLDDCIRRIEEDNISLLAEYDGSTEFDEYTLRIIFYDERSDEEVTACLDDGGTCPFLSITDEATCGCLLAEEGTPTSLNWVGTLGTTDSRFPGWACSRDRILNFRAEVVPTADGVSPVESDEILELETDLNRPLAPQAPSVRPAEQALLVALDEGDGDNSDWARHEVCVRPLLGTSGEAGDADNSGSSDATGGAESDSSGLSNEDLRDSFADCKSTSDLVNGNSYRFEGLSNDQNYEVVLAAFDAAGNRSENSAATSAKPQALFDFAELYSDRLGDSPGESGGCSAVNGAPIWGLLVLVACARFGRRKT